MKKLAKNFLIVLLLLTLFAFFTIAAAINAIFKHYSSGAGEVDKLQSYQPSLTTTIYASNGEIIGWLYKENRIWVPIEEIPPVMKNAIVAIEDSRFYQHHGLDFIGIFRAVRTNLTHGDVAQGGSTITQQLARGIFLSPRRTLERKIREAILALEIERKYSKDEILELYLNQIYFGAGAYGVEAASRTYFGVQAKKLKLGQAALIAGLVAAPSAYSPFSDPKLARERQRQVLKRMQDLGYITAQEAKTAYREPLTYAKSSEEFQTLRYPYFTTYVLHELQSRYNEDLLYRGGLKIYTTMDLKMQNYAQEAVAKGIQASLAEGINGHQAALAAIEPATGFIKAMVGGAKFEVTSQFNRAWQAQRQPGSSFKVFVYTTALLRGDTPSSIVDDSPLYFTGSDGKAWSPKNNDGEYWGRITYKRALQYSRNVCAVKIMQEVGPDEVIKTAYKMGISSHLDPNLSLALGSSVVSPLEMASAFTVFPNGGCRVSPSAIKLIVDSEGRVIEDHRRPQKEPVITPEAAAMMVEMLQNAVEAGTGTRARIPGRAVGGKTGTSDEHRDTWFIGFTPQLAAAVWVGNDDFSKMNSAYGGYIPAMIFEQFVSKSLKDQPAQAFQKAANGLVHLKLCKDSGEIATENCPNTEGKSFLPGKAPTQYCHLHPSTARPAQPKPTETPQAAEPAPEDNPTGPAAEPEVIDLDDKPAPQAPAATPPPPSQPAPAATPNDEPEEIKI